MAAGLLLPAFHCAIKGIPYSIGLVWADAKKGQAFAVLAVASFVIFVSISVFVVIGVLFTKIGA
jgi:hypothetical protein